MSSASYIAIGDIHGCSKSLAALIETLKATPDSQNRTWVFVGDYVDRGPDSKGVVDQLLELYGQ